MNVRPTKLALPDPQHLVIEWSDGERRAYAVQELRKWCPCATCREKRGQEEAAPPNVLPVLSAAEAQPLAIRGMEPVGSYAYAIDFSDGHNTGIYTFEHLRTLGQAVE